mgnify:CR=1 FL=1
MRRTLLGILAVVALVATGCASMESGGMAQKSLYDRLGGRPALTTVVVSDDMIGEYEDERLRKRAAELSARAPRLNILVVGTANY